MSFKHGDDMCRNVVLAALLHDVGKFVQRCDTNPRRMTHAAFGREWLENLWKKHPLPSGLDKDVILTLVEYHHSHRDSKQHPDDLEKLNFDLHTLAWLVCRADSIASGERSTAEGTYADDMRKVPLRPVVVNVDIGRGLKSTDWSVQSGVFTCGKVLPAEGSLAPDYSSEALQNFHNDLANVGASDGDGFLSTIDSILFHHLWSIPAETLTREQGKIQANDISLYEHCRLTAAIAAAGYRYHLDNGDWEIGKVIDDNSAINKYLLVCGDLSGIQKFIYSGVGFRAKGSAKRLRSRSFRLQAVGMAVTSSLCNDLGLPPANVLINSGGNFIILAQDTEKAAQIIKKYRESLDEYFALETWMDTSLNIGTVKMRATDFSLRHFSDKWAETHSALAGMKQHKFETMLSKDGKAAVLEPTGWTSNKDLCANCGRFQGEPSDEDDNHPICERCSTDLKVGRFLASAEVITLSEIRGGAGSYRFTLAGHEVSVSPDRNPSGPPDRGDSVFALENGIDTSSFNPGMHTSFRFIGNHIPRDSQGQPLTFEEIATSGAGVDYMGVLRADVDFLGRVFRDGLVKPDDSAAQVQSASRLLSLSRTFDSFFGGWLPAYMSSVEEDSVCDEKLNPGMIYTVYSGGDDLCLVGRWDQVTLMAYQIRKKFRELVCDNPNITLSAGISIVPKQFPVSEAVRLAGEEEENAKHADPEAKDRISVLGTVFKWEQFGTLMDFARTLLDAKVGKGALYRLLEYWRLGMEFIEDKKKTDALIYRARLRYDLKRIAKIEDKWPEDVFTAFDYENTSFPHLIFPLSWVGYKTRDNRKEEI